MNFELDFDGTPAQFGVVAQLFYWKIRAKYEQGQRPYFNVEVPIVNHSQPYTGRYKSSTIVVSLA